MVEVAVVITLAVVLGLFAMTAVTRWILPKVLYEEDHGEDHTEESPTRPPA